VDGDARLESGEKLLRGEDTESNMTDLRLVVLETPGDAKTVFVDEDCDVEAGNNMDGLAGVRGEASVSVVGLLVLPLDMMACF